MKAEITIPSDLPDVKVLQTEITDHGERRDHGREHD
jgi:hypothetical protein